MQIAQLSEGMEWAFHGGSLGLIATVAYYAVKLSRKAIRRMDRDEDLRSDFPPHRHVNGSILYPHEYEPSAIGRLEPK